MSEQTARLVDRLRQRVRATARRLTRAELAFGAVVVVGAAMLAWLFSAAVEASLWLPSSARWAVIGGLVLVVGSLAAVYLVRPTLRLVGLLSSLSEEAVARRIGAQYPRVADRLVNLLQLTGGHRSPAPDALVDRAAARLGRAVEPVPFEEIEDFSRARRASRWAVLPLAGLLVFLTAAPNAFLGASQRLLAPGVHFQRPAPFHLRIAPGDAALVRGDSLRITVHAEGRRLPQRLTLALRYADETHVEEISLAADSNGIFHYTLANVRMPLHYRAEALPVTTAWHRVTVRERPRVRRLQVTVEPPGYAGRGTRQLVPNVGDVTALPGARVRLHVELGGAPVDSAVVAFDNGARVPLTVKNGGATGAFTLRRAGTYRLRLASEEGVPNRAPIRYTLNVRPDAPPQITLLAPPPDHPLDEDLRTRLTARISDDFGFSNLTLHWRLAERRLGEPMEDFKTIDLSLERGERLVRDIRYVWDLPATTGLGLLPGDVIAYYLEVADNNRVAGYQTARTAIRRLRVPSLAEKYARLDRRQQQVKAQMEDLLEQEAAVREQFERLRTELRRQRGAEWEDRRQLERLRKQQQRLSRGVSKLTRQIEKVTRQMQANDLVSPETMQLYQELQRVAREIKTPALEQALEELRKALQALNLEKMQQALENFSFQEKKFRQRLERTLKLFKKLGVMQELDEAVRRTEALRRREEQLAEATRRLQQNGRKQNREQKPMEAPPAPEVARKDENKPTENQDPSPEAPSDSLQAPSGQLREASTPAERREAMAEMQQRTAQEMRQLMQQLDSLGARMRDMPSAPRQQMQRLNRRLQKQQLARRMQRNSRRLRQGQLRRARRGQQQMQQQLARTGERLRQMRKGMQGRRKRMNRAGLRHALSKTLRLSKRQEALQRKTRGLSPESPAVRRAARQQQRLSEGLRTLSDSLQHLARNVPRMSRAVQQQTGRALRAMQQSTQALTKRRPQQAAGQQQAAMRRLNKLALGLSQVLKQMQRGGQGKGGGMSMKQMAQQLRKMARQQRGLNGQIRKFLNDVQGQRLAANQARRLKQLAARQQAIRKQLNQLRRRSGVKKQALGSLQRVAEQMQQTIEELRRNQFDRRTIKRQQQILSRLLQAQRSLRTRGRDRKQRRAERPEGNFLRESPSELNLDPREADQLRRALLRALESGYAPAYETLIKRYFELLRERK